MPRAIAIETSGRIGSVALIEHGQLLAEEDFPHGLRHASQMVPMVDRLCRERRWRPVDLQELYVSAGPGSFTGLRIGITLAKTLAFAIGLKLVAVPTMRALAENAPPEARHLIIVLDARREQIFTARFERTAGGWAQRDPAHLNRLDAMLRRSPRPVYLLGEGIAFHEKFLDPADDTIVVTPGDLWRARAAAVARIGAQMASRGEWADPERLTPIYIRLPEAEEKRLSANP